ncbi:MAG: 3-phosphoserine/phosphohydroxythreonine transaminase [Firmicutes bacterium]|nr:3-phosphoserine/phosphohydroxythreonine transaminase [Bacillota bacterium]
MQERVFNFNPGPSTLPLEVLQQAQSELLNYKGIGISILEMSHRAPEFEEIVAEAEKLFKELAGVGDDYRVLFLQGGASQQFALVPLNFLAADKTADYVITGSFAEKALKEAQKIGKVNVVATTAAEKHKRIPKQEELNLNKDAAYVHITTNNTIYGTQWHYIPETNGVPLIADMSSDILSRPLDYSKFDLVYAGAQKNLGPSGVVVVMIHKRMLERVKEGLPNIFSYEILAKNNSLYNTPPTFGIYMLKLVLEWLKKFGGLPAIAKHNEAKATLLYDVIDEDDFYRGHAEPAHRSYMNVTFRLPNDELEKTFLQEAEKEGIFGIKGHRSVGGIRASVYNAMSLAGCEKLAAFMRDFKKRNG